MIISHYFNFNVYFYCYFLMHRKFSLFDDIYRCHVSLYGVYQQTNNLQKALQCLDVAINCAQKNTIDKIGEASTLCYKGIVSLSVFNIVESWFI